MDPAVDQIRLDFDPSSILALNIILGILMFGVALDLHPSDFRRLARQPRGPLVGVVAQLLLLPAMTWLLIQVIRPPASVALGMLLVAACPGGNVSNFFTWLARGNTALSVGMTAVTSTAALVMTPFNVTLWGSLDSGAAKLLTEVHLEPWQMLRTILLILGIPLAVGMSLGARFPWLTQRVRRPLRIGGGLLFMAFIVGAFAKNWEFLGALILPLLGLVVLHNAVALSLGYGVGRIARLPRRDARTLAIEVGIQNSGLGLALIFNFFEGLGGMAVVAALWGTWHLVAGLVLAQVWSRVPTGDAVKPMTAASGGSP
ncbi:MAG: bile acid:sodium symporter family protein [Myxococcota bacterium]